jgi:hypothetical protein
MNLSFLVVFFFLCVKKKKMVVFRYPTASLGPPPPQYPTAFVQVFQKTLILLAKSDVKEKYPTATVVPTLPTYGYGAPAPMMMYGGKMKFKHGIMKYKH